jgi:hypothetical protein
MSSVGELSTPVNESTPQSWSVVATSRSDASSGSTSECAQCVEDDGEVDRFLEEGAGDRG